MSQGLGLSSPGPVLSHRTTGLPGTGLRWTALRGHSHSPGTDPDHHCSTLECILLPFRAHDLGFGLHCALTMRRVLDTQSPLAPDLLVCKMQKISALPSSQGAWNNGHYELESDSETETMITENVGQEKKVM